MSSMFEDLRRSMTVEGKPDPASVVAELNRVREQTEAMLGRFTEAMGDNEEQTFDGYSPDGQVCATLDATGTLTEIDVTDAALYDVRYTGESIMIAIKAARLAHSAAMLDLVGKLDGGAFGLMDKLNASLPQETREALKYQRGEY